MDKYKNDINKLKRQQRNITAVVAIAFIAAVIMNNMLEYWYLLTIIPFIVLSGSLAYYLQMKMFQHKCTVCGGRFFKTSQSTTFLRTNGLKCSSCGDQ